jgi:hypothetical protein
MALAGTEGIIEIAKIATVCVHWFAVFRIVEEVYNYFGRGDPDSFRTIVNLVLIALLAKKAPMMFAVIFPGTTYMGF